MPYSPRAYSPPARNTIRERVLLRKLDTLAEYRTKTELALQEARERSLSPYFIASEEAKLEHIIQRLEPSLRDQLTLIKRQNALLQETEDEIAELGPLERARQRGGFFRSEQDRKAAIEGLLKRERRLNAPLTREAWSRAKAIAASRRLFDPEVSQLRGSRGRNYVPAVKDIDWSTMSLLECLDEKRRRREVMFAKGLAGRGYRGRRHYLPC